SLDVRADYGKMSDDPYSRRFDEYRKFHEGTSYPWYDEGFEEEERWESGIIKTDYEPPFVNIDTFEIKRYSFKERRSFICITKQLDDAFPLGRVNGSRFIGMIRKEMDEEGGTIRTMFSQEGNEIRGHIDSYVLWKPSRDFTRPLGPPSGLKGLLHMLNATVIPTKEIRVCSGYDDQEMISCHYHLKYRAIPEGVFCSKSTLNLIISFLYMYNRDIVQTKWGDGSRITT
ncbi:hypothetical protein Tco_0841269, partial [Tanacetum coccineum]